MAKKIRKIIMYFVINTIFIGLLWLGLIEEVTWAKNIGLFQVWVVSILSLFFMHPETIKKLAEEGFSVNQYVDGTVDLGVIFLLAGTGHFISAGAFVVHLIMNMGARAAVKEYKENQVDYAVDKMAGREVNGS